MTITLYWRQRCTGGRREPGADRVESPTTAVAKAPPLWRTIDGNPRPSWADPDVERSRPSSCDCDGRAVSLTIRTVSANPFERGRLPRAPPNQVNIAIWKALKVNYGSLSRIEFLRRLQIQQPTLGAG